jgi:hypothetical protein
MTAQDLGLILQSAKTEKSCFLYKQEISSKQIFPVKQKKILHRFFGAASWQDFCYFFTVNFSQKHSFKFLL